MCVIITLLPSVELQVLDIVGGLSIEKQDRKLGEKPEIVVGTPGRLWELIRSENEHLSKINHIRYLSFT